MSTWSNKKAGERSTTHAISMLKALIVVVLALVVYFVIFAQIGSGAEEARTKGFCAGLMKVRHGVNQAELFPWLPKTSYFGTLGTAIAGTSLFYVSPACGYMYTAPCATAADCKANIIEQIRRCREMQKSEPETSRPCLTDLEINATDLTAGGLCKDAVCGLLEKCGTTEVPNNMISYKSCPQKGDSLFMKYDSTTIEVKCQGKC